MQIKEVRQLITDTYNVLTYSSEYTYITNYIQQEEFIHDDFWRLHKNLTIAKADLREAVNKVSESAEIVMAEIQNIKNLIERDKQNKKKLKKEENMNVKTQYKEKEVV